MTKKIGDKGENIVKEYFRKKRMKAVKVPNKEGYDLKVDKYLIEIKSTTKDTKDKSFFMFSENEFRTMCKNENYWVYWVNTKKGKIIHKISRQEVLENIKAEIKYALPLSKIKGNMKK